MCGVLWKRLLLPHFLCRTPPWVNQDVYPLHTAIPFSFVWVHLGLERFGNFCSGGFTELQLILADHRRPFTHCQHCGTKHGRRQLLGHTGWASPSSFSPRLILLQNAFLTFFRCPWEMPFPGFCFSGLLFCTLIVTCTPTWRPHFTRFACGRKGKISSYLRYYLRTF